MLVNTMLTQLILDFLKLIGVIVIRDSHPCPKLLFLMSDCVRKVNCTWCVAEIVEGEFVVGDVLLLFVVVQISQVPRFDLFSYIVTKLLLFHN